MWAAGFSRCHQATKSDLQSVRWASRKADRRDEGLNSEQVASKSKGGQSALAATRRRGRRVCSRNLSSSRTASCRDAKRTCRKKLLRGPTRPRAPWAPPRSPGPPLIPPRGLRRGRSPPLSDNVKTRRPLFVTSAALPPWALRASIFGSSGQGFGLGDVLGSRAERVRLVRRRTQCSALCVPAFLPRGVCAGRLRGGGVLKSAIF